MSATRDELIARIVEAICPDVVTGARDACYYHANEAQLVVDALADVLPGDDGLIPERAGREGDSQPLPVKNDAEDVQSMVIRDIEARRQVGIKRYGTALQAHNGRNALLDAYEEAIDLCMYLKQRLVEDEALLDDDGNAIQQAGGQP